ASPALLGGLQALAQTCLGHRALPPGATKAHDERAPAGPQLTAVGPLWRSLPARRRADTLRRRSRHSRRRARAHCPHPLVVPVALPGREGFAATGAELA